MKSKSLFKSIHLYSICEYVLDHHWPKLLNYHEIVTQYTLRENVIR